MVIENWIKLEEAIGDETSVAKIKEKIPRKVKKRRKVRVIDDEGMEILKSEMADETEDHSGWEEYYDYIFPEDKVENKKLKILELAQKWKTLKK